MGKYTRWERIKLWFKTTFCNHNWEVYPGKDERSELMVYCHKCNTAKLKKDVDPRVKPGKMRLAVICGRRKYYDKMRIYISKMYRNYPTLNRKYMMPIESLRIPLFMKIIIHFAKILVSPYIYVVKPHGDHTANEVRFANFLRGLGFRKQIIYLDAHSMKGRVIK